MDHLTCFALFSAPGAPEYLIPHALAAPRSTSRFELFALAAVFTGLALFGLLIRKKYFRTHA